MKVSDLLESRRANWRELEELCVRMAKQRRRDVGPRTVARFAALYRGACADLALADAYQLPRATVQYLHELVGRAHNQLYRSQRFDVATWTEQLFVDVPQRLFHDNALRLAFAIFWGIFVLSGALAYSRPEYAHAVVGQETMNQLEEMYAEPPNGANPAMRGAMFGFYIFNNPGIGLRVFAMGLLLGIGGLFATVYNAAFLGGVFGYMATTPESDHFYQFVTAHGPFELTAVVLSAAAGMRLGFSILHTRGLTRMASLRQAANETLPVAMTAVLMFVLAAMIEAFLSPSAAPYWVKAAVSVLSAGSLMFYFVILGYPKDAARATR
ncbi:MAG: stage II sporulation protein M [Pirellulales bacterium]|nr:stage II sporulation protein M [Pirellulales bacterium]